ncbi:hypothetical protein NEPAR06_1877 [Nematocida parisii]|nr:hypothetical protein NEPAR07_1510 [Nematocida parisii]KAI5155495.1 hypothetical protein NEPAR06_1877 [Nematocida parisii]KAI5157763.1 hypothetical protein NEPAR05_1565 [Nematocida parisii]
MKYFCSLCRKAIKYKTPNGWIDHIRGVNHRQKRMFILKPELIKFINQMKKEGMLTHEEHAEIQKVLNNTEDTAEIKKRIENILEESLIRIAHNILN